jgi:hypothetical protein
MRSKLLLVFSLLAAVLAVVAISVRWPAHSSAAPRSSAKQPVILELFTSEGCSSCPPADSLLEKLSQDQPFDGIEILALEEHVDYWNNLGWTDPFSSSQFSERQEQYATTLRDGGVYTPQLVVDGRAQLIGNRTHEVRDQIRWAASVPKPVLLVTPAASNAAGKHSYEVSLDGSSSLPTGAPLELWIAVTEKNLSSNVTAGENSGQSLHHAPVVRSIRKVKTFQSPLNSPIAFDLDLKQNWNPANLTVIAFLADKHTHQIQAAGSTPLQ